MNKKPTVSVIIPIYKAEDFLCRCLDSVLAQTFQNFEVVCINDGSPDNCEKILSKYAKQDKRIRVINKDNTGVSDTRNLGLKLAQGQYVVFLDSDDCLHPQTLEITYFLIKKHNADMVHYMHISKDYSKIKQYMEHTWNKNKVKAKVVNNVLKYATEKNHGGSSWKIRRGFIWAFLFKKSFIRNIKFPTNIKVGEDLVWLLKVLYKRPCAVLTKLPLYFYIPNSCSALSNVNRMNYIQYMSTGLLETWKLFKKSDISTRRLYIHEFAWPVMIPVVRNIKHLDDTHDKAVAKKIVVELYKAGLVTKPNTIKAIKCYFRIKRLLRK